MKKKKEKRKKKKEKRKEKQIKKKSDYDKIFEQMCYDRKQKQ